jgi:Tol biopolymer transport system component
VCFAEYPAGRNRYFLKMQSNSRPDREHKLWHRDPLDGFIINEDGSGQERITYYPDFDAFPMFTSDGKRLVWASNRNGKEPHETNIFIADWVE